MSSPEEESFVVLGSCSPASSITVISLKPSFGAAEKLLAPTSIEAAASIPTTVDLQANELKSSAAATMNGSDATPNPTAAPSLNGSNAPAPNPIAAAAAKEVMESTLKDTSIITKSVNGIGGEQMERSQRNNLDSLAASFILGDVDADQLKSSIYSQFPSLSMETSAEDVAKVQNLMSEYVKIKGVLVEVSGQMNEMCNRLRDMKQEMLETKVTYQDMANKLEECQIQIATLSNQNLELRRDMSEKCEQIQATNEIREKEHAELVQDVSEKTSLIANMRAQIEKLEGEQSHSMEIVPNINKDYVTRSEHERIVKDIQRESSVILAQKLELSDMQKQYIDEITCLKVNLTAAEELIKQSSADIELLKAKDMEKSTRFEEYRTERDEMREQLTLLQHQVEVYSKDFQLERTAREEMAGERTQLLDDLHALQRRNQELSEQVAMLEERISTVVPKPQPRVNGSNPARPIRELRPPSPTDVEEGKHSCPICTKSCISLSTLQTHVNECLDRTT